MMGICNQVVQYILPPPLSIYTIIQNVLKLQVKLLQVKLYLSESILLESYWVLLTFEWNSILKLKEQNEQNLYFSYLTTICDILLLHFTILEGKYCTFAFSSLINY